MGRRGDRPYIDYHAEDRTVFHVKPLARPQPRDQLPASGGRGAWVAGATALTATATPTTG
jgi:hypothetical protein